MDVVFTWAGTYSLERELAPKPVAELAAGDLFIKGGFPGHAVLVADVVENRATGERRFLLVQSFMPAQEMHVLKNPADADGSPWYPLAFGDRLVTPEWMFPRESLRTVEAAVGRNQRQPYCADLWAITGAIRLRHAPSKSARARPAACAAWEAWW